MIWEMIIFSIRIIYFQSRLKFNLGLFWFSFFFWFVYFPFYCNLNPFPFTFYVATTSDLWISAFKIFVCFEDLLIFFVFMPELIESQYLVGCTSLMNCNDKTRMWEQNIFGMPFQKLFTLSQSVDFAF